MVIILPQRGQLRNYLKGDLAELENYMWERVESKLLTQIKKNLPSNIRARMARNCTVFSIGRVRYHALSSTVLYSRLLFFFLAAKTARTPRSWPEVLFFRHSLVISQNALRRTVGLGFGETNSKWSFDKLALTWKRLQSTCSVYYLCPLFS